MTQTPTTQLPSTTTQFSTHRKSKASRHSPPSSIISHFSLHSNCRWRCSSVDASAKFRCSAFLADPGVPGRPPSSIQEPGPRSRSRSDSHNSPPSTLNSQLSLLSSLFAHRTPAAHPPSSSFLLFLLVFSSDNEQLFSPSASRVCQRRGIPPTFQGCPVIEATRSLHWNSLHQHLRATASHQQSLARSLARFFPSPWLPHNQSFFSY